MRQISLKINMPVKSLSIFSNASSGVLFNSIIFCFAALSVLYVVFLGSMVKDIIARRGLEVSARVLSNEVNDLELTYLSMSSSVDLPFSYSLGFKETKPVFATRKSIGYKTSEDLSRQ